MDGPAIDESRLLIIGAKGQLGMALQKRYPAAIAVDRDKLDITSWESVSGFAWDTVDVIVNAAAFTDVDGAETPDGRRAAWQVNAQAVGYLAAVASRQQKTLVHISSEYVFDGTQNPHTEAEPFTPLGVYGQSKAAGDIAAATAEQHYIFRVTWLIGDGKNFVRTMLGLAAKGVSPTVVADQVGRLTFTPTLVDAIHHALTNKLPYGTYNVSNDGEPASWAAVARETFAAAGYGAITVTDTTTAEYFTSKPAAAPRPLQSTLDLSKIKAAGLAPRDWRDELREYVRQQVTDTDKKGSNQ